MMSLQSFLSPHVRSLLELTRAEGNASSLEKNKFEVKTDDSTDSVSVFDSTQGLIDENEINKVIVEKCDYTKEWFYQGIRSISSVGREAHEILLKKIVSGSEEWINNSFFDWAGPRQLFQKCFDEFKDKPDDDLLSIVLLLVLTPAVERGLGDLIIAKFPSCKVPSLMRDILLMPELETIIGAGFLKLLQILLGSPLSLNLRNLVWHGFPRPGEIPAPLASLLAVLIPSIGRRLFADAQAGHGETEIRKRPPASILNVYKIGSHLRRLHSKEGDLQGSSISCQCRSLAQLARHVDLKISQGTEDFRWLSPVMARIAAETKSAADTCPSSEQMNEMKMSSRRFTEVAWSGYLSLALALPTLESLLRHYFVKANQCPERLLTAESSELYTTFTEMLAPSLESGAKNELLSFLGVNYLEILHDLLVLPDGPRLRDRVGHGEVDLQLVPKLCTEAELNNPGRMENVCDNEIIEAAHVVLLTIHWLLLNEENRKHSLGNYSAVFHPTSLLVSSINNLVDNFNRSAFQDDSQDCLQEWCLLLQSSCLPGGDPTSDPAGLCRSIAEACQRFRCKTLYRPKPEYELIRLLQQIQDAMSASLDAGNICISTKRSQMESKTLRSRQRQTYRRMEAVQPTLCHSFVESLLVLFASLNAKDGLIKYDNNRFKKILKYWQNIGSHASIENNKWEVVDEYLDHLKIELQLCGERIMLSMDHPN